MARAPFFLGSRSVSSFFCGWLLCSSYGRSHSSAEPKVSARATKTTKKMSEAERKRAFIFFRHQVVIETLAKERKRKIREAGCPLGCWWCFTDGRDIALLITAAAAAAEGPFIFLSSSPAVLQMMGERILSFLFQRTRNRTITTLFSCCLIYISMIPQERKKVPLFLRASPS